MRILLLSAPRSGSTYLYEVLTAYCAPSTLKKDIYRRNEFFNLEVRNIGRDFHSDLINVFNSEIDELLTQTDVVVKEHINFLRFIKKESPKLFNKFISAFDYIIVMVRTDLFESTLSIVISKMTDEWIHYTQNRKDLLVVDKEFFKTYYYYQKRNLEGLLDNELFINYNEIVYYDTIPSWPRAAFASLQLCNENLDQLKKVALKTPRAPSKKSVVSNYNEIKQYFYEVLDK